MAEAEVIPPNIRRIAVLVSSVDSAAGRQLLLHLPSDVARQVRTALRQMGPIDPSEREQILREFYSTASRKSAAEKSAAHKTAAQNMAAQRSEFFQSGTVSGNSYSVVGGPSVRTSPGSASSIASPDHGVQLDLSAEGEAASAASAGKSPIVDEAASSTWHQMDAQSLAKFIVGERPTVIAVVLQQLQPSMAVSVLAGIPAAMHREILHQLANLQGIDPDAMAAIEQHIAERVSDYESKKKSQAVGSQRLVALLAAAPPELQSAWVQLIQAEPAVVAGSSTALGSQATLGSAFGVEYGATLGRPYSVPGPAPAVASAAVSQQADPAVSGSIVGSTGPVDVDAPGSALGDAPTILPFPSRRDAVAAAELNEIDRSLIQLEFERLLQLSTSQLAEVLTLSDSRTVLLALAGASPAFMKRFYAMMPKHDARMLEGRISQIGPTRLREIDDAQRQIAELAARLFSNRSVPSRTVTPRSTRAVA